MIPFVIVTSLVASGLISAVWKDRCQKKKDCLINQTASASNQIIYTSQTNKKNNLGGSPSNAVDDVTAIFHYKRISFVTLGLVSLGNLFYFPLILASLPLITYNYYFLLKMIRLNARKKGSFSIIMLYEIITLSLLLLMRHFLFASFSLMLSFMLRQLILQIGNFSQIKPIDLQNIDFKKVWVLYQGIEIEKSLSNIKRGDIIVVRHGEIIPFNGTVDSGKALVKQYSLQGKMTSITKEAGSRILAFTQIKKGVLYIRYD